MSLGIDFAAFGATNPFTAGTTAYTAIDTYNTALENNGALQPLGSMWPSPLPTSPLSTVAGQGEQLLLKYVRYNPTVTQTIQAGPALLYWKDETFTTVTPLYSEAYLSALQSSGVAGWLMYNTTTLAGALATSINGNFCWIAVGGFLPGCFVTAATVGQGIYGVATGTAWATTATAPAPARLAGIALTAASSNLSDLYIPYLN